jgi:hypothetical protein
MKGVRNNVRDKEFIISEMRSLRTTEAAQSSKSTIQSNKPLFTVQPMNHVGPRRSSHLEKHRHPPPPLTDSLGGSYFSFVARLRKF